MWALTLAASLLYFGRRTLGSSQSRYHYSNRIHRFNIVLKDLQKCLDSLYLKHLKGKDSPLYLYWFEASN
jgi:hypothetical protein